MKNAEIINDSMIALSPKEKKYTKTTDLSLYLKRLSIVQTVIIPEEIANCRKYKTKKMRSLSKCFAIISKTLEKIKGVVSSNTGIIHENTNQQLNDPIQTEQMIDQLIG